MAIWDDIIPREDLAMFAKSKMGWPAVKAVTDLLAKGREKDIPIFFSRGDHFKTPSERGRWKHETHQETKAFDPKEHEIVDDIKPGEGDVVITKIFPSAFFNTNLASMLIFHNVDTVIVTGMVTSGCVRATVVDAFSYNYNVVVPEECVGDRGVVSHKVSLFDMHMKYANVVPLSDVLEYLGSLS